jgi:hypothetical protein
MRRAGAIAFFTAVGLAMSAACGGDDNAGPLNPAGVGNHCAKNEDCATLNCYLGRAGGYCTSACASEGDTSQCPLDTVCKPIQGGPARCLLVCGSASTCGERTCPDAFCPIGSSCVSVSGTSLRACEPEPN